MKKYLGFFFICHRYRYRIAKHLLGLVKLLIDLYHCFRDHHSVEEI